MYRLFLVPFLLVPAAAPGQEAAPPAPPSVQSREAPLPSATFGEPYARLFGNPAAAPAWQREPPPGDRQPGAPESVLAKPRRKVVCGTTLIIVDGREVDPKMVLAPKSDTRFSMPRMPPPACGKK